MSTDVIDLTPRTTGGHMPLMRERALDERLQDVASRVTRTNVIAVVGPQGGAGKTRITFTVGAALAQQAGLNVIAMDLDNDYGALVDLVPEKTRVTRSFETLMGEDGAIPFPRLRSALSVTRSRMLILRGPEDDANLDGVLPRLANADVVMFDCAAGVHRPRARWALEHADQVIVVARPEPSGSKAAARETGRALRDIDASCMLVINRRRRRTDVSHVQQAFQGVPALSRQLELPESLRLARQLEATRYDLRDMWPHARIAIKDLAATVGESLR